jgi:hypothetical protein
LITSTIGCNRTAPTAEMPLHIRAASAVGLGFAIATEDDNVNPVKKVKRSECTVCKGTGKYLSGDGISWVPCGYCEPPATVEPSVKEEPKPEPEPKPQVEPAPIIDDYHKPAPKKKLDLFSQKCCPDCTCADGDCNCVYPGQCLVEANKGKDVTVYEETQVCNRGVCRIVKTPVRKYSANKKTQVLK